MSDNILSYDLDGDVAVLSLDDGKANAINPATVTALDEALTRAEGEAGALLLTGREGKLSAGFDLSVMTSGEEAMQSLVRSGAELLVRWYASPLPTVAACTGHALAAGALILLVGDIRVGAAGDFKIGLNEVAIGMQLPVFAVELARDRLTPSQFTAATMGARIYSPDEATAAGYLDLVVAPDELLPTATAEAARLAELRTGAYTETKLRARATTVDFARSTLHEDMAHMEVPQP